MSCFGEDECELVSFCSRYWQDVRRLEGTIIKSFVAKSIVVVRSGPNCVMREDFRLKFFKKMISGKC